MSSERAVAYCLCIANYIGNLKHIHPTFGLQPNHHALFHIYNYLVLSGPVHSWWTFPFEQLIGILQRLSSNHKHGDVTTMTSNHPVPYCLITSTCSLSVYSMYSPFPFLSICLVVPPIGEHVVRSVSLFDYLICFLSHFWSLYFPSRSITNTILIGNPVITVTILTQRAAQLHLSFVGNPDSPYITSSVLLSINI